QDASRRRRVGRRRRARNGSRRGVKGRQRARGAPPAGSLSVIRASTILTLGARLEPGHPLHSSPARDSPSGRGFSSNIRLTGPIRRSPPREPRLGGGDVGERLPSDASLPFPPSSPP